MDTQSKDAQTTSRTRIHSRKRHWWLLLIAPVLAGGALAARAYAFGPGMPGFGPRPGGSPEEHKAFMQRRLEKLLDKVDATETQRAAIRNIAERLRAEMEPIHGEHVKLHDQMARAFTGPSVDAAAVEKLRVQATAAMERGSRALARALIDAGNVLSAEQRQNIIEHIKEHHGRHHRGL